MIDWYVLGQVHSLKSVYVLRYVKLCLLVSTLCEYIIVPSRLSLNDVRSNGGRLMYSSSISAKNYALIELLILNIEKLCSYNIDHNSWFLGCYWNTNGKQGFPTHIYGYGHGHLSYIRWFLIGIPLNEFVYSIAILDYIYTTFMLLSL